MCVSRVGARFCRSSGCCCAPQFSLATDEDEIPARKLPNGGGSKLLRLAQLRRLNPIVGFEFADGEHACHTAAGRDDCPARKLHATHRTIIVLAVTGITTCAVQHIQALHISPAHLSHDKNCRRDRPTALTAFPPLAHHPASHPAERWCSNKVEVGPVRA